MSEADRSHEPEEARRERFLAAVRAANLRFSASGDHRVEIQWVDRRGDVRAEGMAVPGAKLWNAWGRATDSVFTFRVPGDWTSTVAEPGLAVLGGRLTLYAEKVHWDGAGAEVYRAVWASQGRGFSLHTDRGYLGRSPKAFHHSGSVGNAYWGMKRKERHPTRTKSRRPRLWEEGQRWGSLPVTLADALEVGLCEDGVRRWCREVGINPDAGATTLGAVIAGYRLRPRPLVLRFIRYMVEVAGWCPPAGSQVTFTAEGGFTAG